MSTACTKSNSVCDGSYLARSETCRLELGPHSRHSLRTSCEAGKNCEMQETIMAEKRAAFCLVFLVFASGLDQCAACTKSSSVCDGSYLARSEICRLELSPHCRHSLRTSCETGKNCEMQETIMAEKRAAFCLVFLVFTSGLDQRCMH